MESLAPARFTSVSGGAPLCLLIISQSRFLREALAAVFDRDHGVAVVASADVTEMRADLVAPVDAVLLYAEHREDLAFVRRLHDALPGRPIIACGLEENEEDDAIATGVTGCIPNATCLAQFSRIVKELLGDRRLCAEIGYEEVVH